MIRLLTISFFWLWAFPVLAVLTLSSDANTVVREQPEIQSACPESHRDWKRFKIREFNKSEFEECVTRLKKDYLKDTIYDYMEKEDMYDVLLKRYQDLVDFYEDGRQGDDPEKATGLKTELEALKRKPPKQEMKSDKKGD